MKSLIFSLGIVIIFACGRDKDPVPTPPLPNQEELITTMKIQLSADGETTSFSFRDLDGPGGNDPSIDTVVLKQNATYTGELFLLNETTTPADTISNEVKEEAEEHQLFYNYSVVEGEVISISYSDFDVNNVPLGLLFSATSGVVGKGNLKIVLKHQPGIKPKSGTGNETIGSTDVEVIFPVRVIQ